MAEPFLYFGNVAFVVESVGSGCGPCPMSNLLSILAVVTALLGPVTTIIGLIQSRGWMAGIGAFLVCASILSVLYARQQRLRVVSASIEIDGISIDAVNAANLRRRVNRSLTVQTAEHTATIDGVDLEITWRYTGYCRVARETAMEFSVDSGASIPFTRLDCFAYDLKGDPEKRHKIQPLLIGPDGISKKIAVPFLQPLQANQPFDVMLRCRLPATYTTRTGYYVSTLSFDQDTVVMCTVQLIFLRQRPDWVRVYECDSTGRPRLLKNLPPVREDEKSSEYQDIGDNLPAQSARIYVFHRPEA